ncbi:MAG: adenylosuccinate synthase [Candidatus Wallbacteria bacterium]|nr:adenylosuccinate synthase [Candidatus Wallbacteria bacterium]
MPAIVVVGAQWGDEGKGKITDYLAAKAHAVVRYQGGSNAGHTVVVGDDRYKLHLVPSGVLYASIECLLGNGVVIDLPELVKELRELEKRGVNTSRLLLSESAHLILPYHKLIDGLEEEARGSASIGTTRRGIGPAYRDKVNRAGIRLCDLRHASVFRDRLDANRKEKAGMLAGHGLDWEQMAAQQLEAFAHVEKQVRDVGERIESLLDRGANVLFEGAQGTFLDIDHGTYPYVTSSTPTAGGACIGTGIGPCRMDAVLGVTKAYCTRVGMGPFTTEAMDDEGDRLVDRGAEFGTTTGRRRRPGWLDTVMLRYAVRVNSLSGLAVTKLDVLDHFERVRLCTAYEAGGQMHKSFPADPELLKCVKPVYEDVEGWNCDTSGARAFSDLPQKAKDFLKRLTELAGVPVLLVSVGASRDATLELGDPWELRRGR